MSPRSWLVSLVALLFAVAAGVALGGGPLSDVGAGTLTAGGEQATDAPPAEETGFGDDFAEAAAPRLYAGRLEGRRVALLALPGAGEPAVRGLGAEVERAGGRVTATYAVRAGLLSPGGKTLVDSLGRQLADQLGGGVVDRSAATYQRIGQLLGRAVASREAGGKPTDDDAAAIAQSLTGAGLLRAPDPLPGRAPLVLVVTGAADVDDDVLAGLLAGLADRSVGVVVAGPTGSPDLAALRRAPGTGRVATVDGVEVGAGRVAATLTLVRSLREPGGSFGASGADGAFPLG